jgi:ubiquinone/menaquinone biosynthesis C-methylase UbiE
MDLADISVGDESFDVIICNHVLEHIIDDHKAMTELYRVLKPKGWAILQVPISPTLTHTFEDFSLTTDTQREAAFGQHDHVRIYANDYIQRLDKAGFAVTIFKWHSEPEQFGGANNRFALNEHEWLYLATKP